MEGEGIAKFQMGMTNVEAWFSSIGIPGFAAYIVALNGYIPDFVKTEYSLRSLSFTIRHKHWLKEELF